MDRPSNILCEQVAFTARLFWDISRPAAAGNRFLLSFGALPREPSARWPPLCPALHRALPPSSYDDPWPAARVSARCVAKSGKISMPPLTSRSSHDFFAGGFASKDHRVLIGALVRCSRRAIRKLSNASQTSRFRHIHKNNMALTPYGTCHAA